MSVSLSSLSGIARSRLGYDFESLLLTRFSDDLLISPLSASLPRIVDGLALKVDDHRNGFVRAILEMDRSVFASVRIHYWKEAPRPGLGSDIHNHAWDFLSCVLTGMLKISEFEESPGTSFYRNVAATGKQVLEEFEEGPCDLERQVVKRVSSEKIHAAEAGTIHLVEPIKVPCMTLFFQGPHKRSFSYFYSNKKRKVVHPADLLPSELNELSREFAEILR